MQYNNFKRCCVPKRSPCGRIFIYPNFMHHCIIAVQVVRAKPGTPDSVNSAGVTRGNASTTSVEVRIMFNSEFPLACCFTRAER